MSLVWTRPQPPPDTSCANGICSIKQTLALVPAQPKSVRQTPAQPAQPRSTQTLATPSAGALTKGASGDKQGASWARNDTVSIATERLAFKRWLLYVLPDERACIAAMQLVVQIESDVHITNLATVPRDKRPAWLTGVPTLVDLQGQLKYEGTAALEQLQQYVAAEPLPVSSMNKQYYKLGDAGDTERDWGAPASQHDFIMPDLGTDPRYETQVPIQAAHLEALRSARQAQLDDLKSGIDNKPDPDRALPAPSHGAEGPTPRKALPPPPRAR